ncbi:MAG: HAMP domain-containing histidine kinase [Deltaproteobacteria bacterium]|nr:HAMP domain-containing histidine kinase [Deltaproteobacteria bacterium]
MTATDATVAPTLDVKKKKKIAEASLALANLTPEETARHEAQQIAEKRVHFVGQIVIWSGVVLFLATVADCEAAAIVGLIWGIFLARSGYRTLFAPRLERKWMEEELAFRMKQIEEQRRSSEGRTSRSLEELSASIAHEIRNPITAAKSLVQQMGEDPASTENVEYAKIALEELDRVERSISHLLRYAREEALQLQDVSLTEIVDSALESFRDRLSKTGTRIVRDHDGPGRFRGDPEKLRRVVINLIGNALDALEEGPTPSPEIRISSGQNLAGTELWLSVRDNGPGIPEEKRSKIFSPFYTSKTSGTGLGLAISKKLVDAHGGTIEVKSEPGLYSELVLTFPRPAESAENEPKKEQ